MEPSPNPDTRAPGTPARPVLLPGLRRLWRDQETLQLGRGPVGAVVLAGIDEPVRAALALLDGTRDTARLQADAARVGLAHEQTDELVRLLHGAGVLEDAAIPVPALQDLPREDRDRLAPDLAALSLVTQGRPAEAVEHRRRTRVRVVGAGRVGSALAVALVAAGVADVDVHDDGLTRPGDVGIGGLATSDVGRSRGEAARERLRAAVPSTRTGPLDAPDLVVLAPVGPPDELLAAELVRQGTPHLLVEVREQVGVVGPLVLPGRSSCLHCHDLTRADLDPGWPWLAAQLSTPTSRPAPCDAVLAWSVAAVAAEQVLHLVDQRPGVAVLDGTLEHVPPDYRWRRRSWSRHPACPCGLLDVG